MRAARANHDRDDCAMRNLEWPYRLRPKKACLLCAEPLLEDCLCTGCRADLPRNLSCCARCAAPLVRDVSLCGACQKDAPSFDQLIAPLRYEFPVSRLLIQWKYHRRHELAALFTSIAVASFVDAVIEFDCIVAIPLHWRRYLWRGFNQAQNLADAIALVSSRSCHPKALSRSRPTERQSLKPMKARQANVARAFLAEPRIVAGRRWLLVDDVATSGHTLNAAAVALKRAGASSVIAWVAARA